MLKKERKEKKRKRKEKGFPDSTRVKLKMGTKAHNFNNSLYSTVIFNPANYGWRKHGQVPSILRELKGFR